MHNNVLITLQQYKLIKLSIKRFEYFTNFRKSSSVSLTEGKKRKITKVIFPYFRGHFKDQVFLYSIAKFSVSLGYFSNYERQGKRDCFTICVGSIVQKVIQFFAILQEM